MNEINTILKLHKWTERFVVLGARLIAVWIITGVAFTGLCLSVYRMTRFPEFYLKLQAFELNYREMIKENRHAAAPEKDPNWDGTLAGIGAGLAYGRSVPIIGPVLGCVFGSVVGYELDDAL